MTAKASVDSAPTSVADFERLLLSSPNSSYLWIQYMSFYLSLSQTDTARSISDRALKSIHYREEAEKLNVWVAKMNLENSYGTEQELESVFEVASRSNDSKTVYLRLVDIYERSGKFDVGFFLAVFTSLHVTVLIPFLLVVASIG